MQLCENNSRNTDILSPPPLEPREVPNVLKCAICFGIPFEPRVTPCEHVFCQRCIHQVIAINNDGDESTSESHPCPTCRRHFQQNELNEFQKGTLVHRIWSDLQVRCTQHEEGCTWTGTIEAFISHFRTIHPELFDPKEQEIRSLKRHIETLERRISQLEENENTMTAQISELTDENDNMKRQINHDYRLRLPNLFSGTYNYNSGSVVKLTQLISRYLENKPHQLDSDRIFNCVNTCYRELENAQDWPNHYYVDMRMLLATCAASTWFSENQDSRIRSWLLAQGWD